MTIQILLIPTPIKVKQAYHLAFLRKFSFAFASQNKQIILAINQTTSLVNVELVVALDLLWDCELEELEQLELEALWPRASAILPVPLQDRDQSCLVFNHISYK